MRTASIRPEPGQEPQVRRHGVAVAGRRLVQLLLLALLAVGVSACKTDADLSIVVEEDGSGLVGLNLALDEDAANDVVDLSTTGLPLSDLAQAGWDIQPPAVGDDNITRVGVSKAFGTPEQFAEIMAELDGGSGVFTDFAITRNNGFATVEYQVVGTINPVGFSAFGDPELATTLGQTLDDIAAHYGTSPADVTITVDIITPGTLEGAASPSETAVNVPDGASRAWTTTLGAASSTDILIASKTTDVIALVWRGVSIVAGVLAVLVAFGHLLRILRPERRRRKKQVQRKSGTATAKRTAAELSEMATKPTKTTTSVALDDGDSSPLVVALDGMGVLYREGHDTTSLLVPFAREMGSLASEQEIVRGSRLLSLGRLTPAEFWKGIGLAGDPNEIDDAYLSLHQLTPGVIAFLRNLRSQGVQVAVITNDSSVWANKLRKRHSLDGLIHPWIVSGSVGVRKPDRPIFEVLRRVTEQPPGRILVVDDELDNLDAAAEFGFQTAWFSPDATADAARGHQILRSFNVPAANDAGSAAQ